MLLLYLPFGIQEPYLAVLEHFAFEIVIDIVLFLHDLDVFRTNEHAHFRTGQELMIVLNQKLIAVRGQYTHLVMHSLEDTSLHLSVPLREFPLWYPVIKIHIILILSFVLRPSSFVPYIYVFRSYHHIHRIVLAETGVDTVELLAAELHAFVANHSSTEDITLTDEIRHKAVLRLVIDVGRRTYLLNLAFAHHHHTVGQRQRFFLVVRHVDKRDS